jgi:hypothetical protein
LRYIVNQWKKLALVIRGRKLASQYAASKNIFSATQARKPYEHICRALPSRM